MAAPVVKIDWSKVPSWVQFVTISPGGNVKVYKDTPNWLSGKNHWYNSATRMQSLTLEEAESLFCNTPLLNGGPDCLWERAYGQAESKKKTEYETMAERLLVNADEHLQKANRRKQAAKLLKSKEFLKVVKDFEECGFQIRVMEY